jgi:hypothetical protein
MHPVFKRILKIIAWVVAIPIGLIVVLIGVAFAYAAYLDAMLPTICKDIARGQDIAQTFDSRVQKMYSMPILSDELEKSLQQQRFTVSTPSPYSLLPPDQRIAHATQSFIPCNRSWTIQWTKGTDGMAHDIHGSYDAVCL